MSKGKQKVHSLTGRTTSQVMNQSWKAVRRNRGSAGIDKVSLGMFEQNLEANLARLMGELKDGSSPHVGSIPQGSGRVSTS